LVPNALREQRQEQRDGRAMIAEAIQAAADNLTIQITAVTAELVGVNKRLDTVNGRMYRHEGQIAAIEARTEGTAAPISRKTKAAVIAGGGVGILAVLHSMFEMVKAIGPSLLALIHGK